MSTGADEIRGRIASLCVTDPFLLTESADPFSFELQPTDVMGGVFRIESEQLSVLGGFNFSEERTDLMRIWVARHQESQPEVIYQQLQADARSLRAAVVRDGCVGGDYGVPDGGGVQISHERGQEFAVLQLTVPVSYEADL